MSTPTSTSVTPVATVARRRFLAGSLAAAGTSVLAGRILNRAVRADDAPAASAGPRKIKLGVVGCGGRGAWIARLFARHGGYELLAVADYFDPVAQTAGDALGVARSRRFSGLHGYQKLLASGVEAVALETPPYCFPEQVAAAVQAGLHVYLAKPIAVDVPGCLAVEAAAARATAAGQTFLVDYQMPTDPAHQEVVRRVHAGDIGPLALVNSHYYGSVFPDPPPTATIESRLQQLIWVNDVALGGSYHVNACIHAIDAALWVIGSRPLRATATSQRVRPDPHGDSHDAYTVLLEFASGVLLSHQGKHLNNSSGFDVACDIQGQQGCARLMYGGRAQLKSGAGEFDVPVDNLYEAGAVRNIAAFYDSILAHDAHNPTVARSVDGALTTILAREAALRGAPLSMTELLAENKCRPADLTGLRA